LRKGRGGGLRKQPVVFGRSEEEMEEGPSTPAAAGAAEVANASNCGHFIMISRTCESPPPLEEE